MTNKINTTYREHPRILIVEDDGIIAYHLEQTLSRQGYGVTGVFTSGEKALQHIDECQPDLVLMDIYLTGEMNGIESAAQIKARWDVPVVYLTAHPEDTLWEQAKTTEPYGYLSKPVQDRDLFATIETALYKHRMEARLRESETRYRLVSELVSDFAYAFRVEPDGTLIHEWTTKAFTRVTGYTLDELETQERWCAIIHPDDRTLEGLQDMLSGHPGEGELRILTKQGKTRYLHLYNRPIIDDHQGRVVRIVGAAQDITEQKRAEKAMHQYAEELKKRNEELDAFTHTVAHDLKSPLGYLVGFAELMIDDNFPITEEEQADILQKIAWTGRKMSHIVDNLLLLANVRQVEIDLAPLDMGRVVREALSRLQTTVKACQADVILPPEEAWPVVLGHAAWIEGVWVNYLSNALKYGGQPRKDTPPRIELGFDHVVPDGADAQIRFWVRDNGPGLTPEEQARLFNTFARLDRIQAQGHGLGLSIVQRIVQKLGGQVGVESQVGQGSMFYFTLKRANEEKRYSR